MKKIFLLALTATILIGCDNYGNKVKINDVVEVYYKGDSVNETDAKKLGNYLAELWKEQTNEKSFQLTKENGSFIVKMVVDEKKVSADTTIEAGFMALKTLVGEGVFPGTPVRFIITNDRFKDIKEF